MGKKNEKYTFNISLSVLNHLGRNLYRSFTTVLGEAISNSWDAEAENVWIYIDKNKQKLVIKDDGIGMSSDDFKNKFLKIGYSKRKENQHSSATKKRPYIGRKGIGKLALLSCAEKITVVSKKKSTNFIGGVITNQGLDSAIHDDMTPQDYELGSIQLDDFSEYTGDHTNGTIILFEDLKGGVKNSLEFIRKTLSLYFRFSLVDENFNIFVDDKKISFSDLNSLKEKTEFCWIINKLKDPFVDFLDRVQEKCNYQFSIKEVNGFIASVKKPSDMTIRGMDEKLTVDLFVNGRLREKNILKNIASNRVPESYIYGQIHFNSLDGIADPFTSSREGIVSDNNEYQDFLKKIRREVILKVISEWDKLRRKYKKTGDAENKDIPLKQRKAEEFYDEATSDYTNNNNKRVSKKNAGRKSDIENWIDELKDDATFCFSSYTDCYLSENLVRKHIIANNIPLSAKVEQQITGYKNKEKAAKGKGNISITIRNSDQKGLAYLSMTELAAFIDMDKGKVTTTSQLYRDAIGYKPMRDALMHTSRLTDPAKQRLNSVFENIKQRIIALLNGTSS